MATDDFANTLWQEFANETEEHLTLVEPILARAGTETADANGIAQLFRSFHSIKGLARAMDLRDMEEVAHRAEDILGIVRDGRATLDGAAADALLEAVDALGQMRVKALKKRGNVAAPKTLGRKLDDLFAAMGGAQAPASEEETPPTIASGGDAGQGFHDNMEMVAIFAELVRDRVSDLALALGPGFAEPAARATACDAASSLAHGAGVMGFDQLAENLNALNALYEAADGVLDGDQRSQAVTLLSALRGQIETLAELSGQDTGHDRLAVTIDGLLVQAERAPFEAAALPPAETRAAIPEIEGLAVHIHPELREILSLENVSELNQAIAAGQNLYEILVDFESEPAVASALLAWLSDGVRAITNRTILKGDASWFEFLLLSHLDATAFKNKLLDLDGNLACIKAARHVTETEEGEALLGDTTQPELTMLDAAAGASSAQQGSIVLRVSGETIDRFMTQIGEVRVDATGLSQLIDEGGLIGILAALRRLAVQLPGEPAEALTREIQRLDEHRRQLHQIDERIDGALARLHAGALDLRVVPIDTILNRFPRIVRDLAQTVGKQIQLKVEGRDVKVDKSTVQLLTDPLMHMVRNSADHGIEPPEERVVRGKPAMATITMRAAQRGNEVTVEVSDDGRGLNTEAIRRKAVMRGLIDEEASRRLPMDEICRFILQPGFSTAEQVTETSGRGVGMDVVNASVVRLGGEIEIRTRPGQGATFVLHLPLSAALQTALIVEVGGQNLAIPERAVAAVEEIEAAAVRMVGHQRTVLRQGQLMPIYRLGQLLRLGEAGDGAGTHFPLVVVASGPHAIGLEVDRLRRRQELFLKDLHPKLAAFPAIGGASVMGDGRVVLVLDAEGLIQLARRSVATVEAADRNRMPGGSMS